MNYKEFFTDDLKAGLLFGFVLGMCFIGILTEYVSPDFTIQDVCSECNDVYGMSEGYCIKTYVIPSSSKVDSFCHTNGYKSGCLTDLVTQVGINCYTKEGDITREHFYSNEEINFIYEQGEATDDGD